MKIFRQPLPWLLTVAFAVILTTLFLLRGHDDDRSRPLENHARGDLPQLPRLAGDSPRGDRRATRDPAEIIRLLQETSRHLGEAEDAPAALALLDNLQQALSSFPRESAAKAVAAFFDSGADTTTGLPFRVGGGGALDAAPTFRVFLLDLLPGIDPDRALALSRLVIATTPSADEFAVALRNLAWSDLDGDHRSELRSHFASMLDRENWRAAPTAGFLEALDAAVWLGDAEAFQLVLGLNARAAADPAGPVRQAGFMTLDAMVERTPALLSEVGSSADLSPSQRASLMSRLDLREPEQRDLFVEYLTTAADSSELGYFAELFPNGSHLRGQRLFSTPTRTPSIGEREDADRETLRELSQLEWPAGSPAAETVAEIRQRLERLLE